MCRFLFLTALVFMTGFAGLAQNFSQVLKAVASDRAASDRFGYSVAISGDYALMGAPLEDQNASGTATLSAAGSVYVFHRTGSGWTQVQKLVPTDRGAGDNFGTSVAISGDRAIIGAHLEDHDVSGLNNMPSAGAAYVFERNGSGTWVQVQKLVASDRDTLDQFGFTVAIDSNYAIVGAHNEDEDSAGANTLSASGAAYVFERNSGGTWVQVQKLNAPVRAASDFFGYDVTVDGNYALIGAHQEDENALDTITVTNAGSVFVFERNGSGHWGLAQKLVSSDRAASDFFGFSLSVNDSRVAIGAYQEDHNATGTGNLSAAGSVYIFERNTSGVWTQQQKIVPTDRSAGDWFGYAVNLSGDRVLVSAYKQEQDASGSNSLLDAGAAYIFQRNTSGTWAQMQKLTAADRNENDFFGFSVGLSGLYAVCGSYSDDHDAAGSNALLDAGSTYFFETCIGATHTISETACDSYTLNGQTYTATGTYTQTLTSALGCDSVITINLTVFHSSDSSLEEETCGAYTLNGQTYTSSGIYTQTLTNAEGCDSTITLDLTIFEAANTTFTESACDSFELNGQTYTGSGTYVQTFTGAGGCDSTVTLHLTINTPSDSTLSASACESYTINGQTYDSTGTYTQVLTNAAGCDSVLTINLVINDTSSFTIADSACDSYTLNGQTYTSTGSYTQVLTNAAGCDSILTLDLVISHSTSLPMEVDTCDSFNLNGQLYTATGVYNQALTNAAGCDSNIVLDLNIRYSTSSSFTISACGSFNFNGNEYDSSGLYVQLSENSAGCLHVETLDLTIFEVLTSTVAASTCDSFSFNGQTYTTSGLYTHTFSSAEGCDSIVTLDLDVHEVDVEVVQSISTLNAQALGATFQWLDCSNGFTAIANETGASFTPAVNGSYAVEVTQNGCTDTSGCQNISNVGVGETPFAGSSVLYPNPTQGGFTIDLGSVYPELLLEITDLSGRMVLRERYSGTRMLKADLQSAAGVYFVKVSAPDGETIFRLVKE